MIMLTEWYIADSTTASNQACSSNLPTASTRGRSSSDTPAAQCDLSLLRSIISSDQGTRLTSQESCRAKQHAVCVFVSAVLRSPGGPQYPQVEESAGTGEMIESIGYQFLCYMRMLRLGVQQLMQGDKIVYTGDSVCEYNLYVADFKCPNVDVRAGAGMSRCIAYAAAAGDDGGSRWWKRKQETHIVSARGMARESGMRCITNRCAR